MLEEKIAIVTGGAVGIGKAIAERFLADGATVVIADIDEKTGAATADDLGCAFEHCDVRDYEQVEALVEGVVETYGGLDVMVNNAGVASVTSVEEMDLEEWRAVVETNLDGVMHGTKAALPHLKETDGSIINLGSIYGLVGGKGAASYSAAKGGVVNFTQQVAIDYATEGVRVNSICPGFVETPMTEDLLEDERFYSYLEQKTPMDRHGQPEEIAPMAAFLASDDASYITGANIPVDGGWTAF
ncbi:SDR family NAD(P)-dependent oxidoreductase [Natronorubrum sulfidifaciens]|uniref:3-oxoacyl-ACP reductase n=1 Tax=Natronorubrum sulfidifaciens JCM 14089 TaxID=1230460 RepID=L9W569_9EURY|nr:SDR family NAD(P)-dependent oxidoreductase [Natronorubrum sulfidifaciens]ELY44614.1 3-oxoacyl-ACP reductase [Natronorubrum sulfidifaciens JCM 14089]